MAEMTAEPAAGSLKFACPTCDAAIWIAPSSMQMLASDVPYVLRCMQCASSANGEEARTDSEVNLAEMVRLRTQAEAAYDKMYDLFNDYEIKWQYELASETLRSAAELARELGLMEEGDACETRAEHIRKVFRHQFMRPPDLTA
jgi:hypothetical protein